MKYDFSKLNKYINTLKFEKGIPSSDIIVYYKGNNVYRYTIGAAKDTLYYLFSCTKPVTAVAAMQLVERGTIGLDDPVCYYIPEYGRTRYRQNENLIQVGETLKIRHLLTMSAGLSYDCDTNEIKIIKNSNPKASTLEIITALANNAILEFKPGTRFRYSLCIDVLAGIIEIATGTRFSEYLKQNIFAPLEMTDSTFHLQTNMKSKLAPSYYVENGKILPCHKGIGNLAITENYESGGAGLISSTSDFGKFAAALSNGGISKSGARVLKQETIDLLRSPQISNNQGFSCSTGNGYSYGYGVRTLVTNIFGAKSTIGEFGWDGAAGAFILIDPVAKVGIVYTQQLLGWFDYLGSIHSPMRDLTYEALGI